MSQEDGAGHRPELRRRGRGAVVLLAVAVAATLPATAAGAALSAPVSSRVSVGSAGVQRNGQLKLVSPAAISDRGRFVAFATNASNLVPADTDRTTDAFVRDRSAGTTSLISVSSAGAPANGPSDDPSLSGDGRYVAFTSSASNLVPGDANGATDIFVRDLLAGTTERISLGPGGSAIGIGSADPAISADGRYVAFSSSERLVARDRNRHRDIFVRDRSSGTTALVSVSSTGSQSNLNNATPAISDAGRYVVFYSTASNLVPRDTNNLGDVFVRDRQTGTTQRVSVSSTGAQVSGGSGFSFDPEISAAGRYVAFQSNASNLVPGDTNGWDDVFVRDRQTGTTQRVSVSSAGAQSNDDGSGRVSISADGRVVVFESISSSLATGDTNNLDDVFLRDRATGTTTRVSVSTTGAQADGFSFEPAISADGKHIAFSSSATNLVPGDTNGRWDVFVRDLP